MDPYDFSGIVTAYEVPCGDGRVIEDGAFNHQAGEIVPLVWRHGHDDIRNFLGHVLLTVNADPAGMRGYAKFNSTTEARRAKELVHNGDINAFSIYANELREYIQGRNKRVQTGTIREASLVLTGQNPGAKIDDVVRHSDDPLDPDMVVLDGIIIHNNEGLFELPVEEEEEVPPDKTEETVEEPVIHESKTLRDVLNSLTKDQKNLFAIIVHSAMTGETSPQVAATSNGSANGPTVQEIYDGLTEEQKNVLHFMAGELSQQEDSNISQGDTNMLSPTFNIFEGGNGGQNVKDKHLVHEQFRNVLKVARDTRVPSLRDLIRQDDALAHSITDIDFLFPDARNVEGGGPMFYARKMEWVEQVLGATRPRPFARIKSQYADLTPDAARAKGYVTGDQKAEEVITVLKRVTTPQTIYKLQKLDRDDIIDITDFDVVVWLKSEMKMMLREELARALLISDGRSGAATDKIVEINVRPIYNDDPVYTIDAIYNDVGNLKPLSSFTAAEVIDLIDFIATQRSFYRGAGSPVFYTQPEVLTKLLLVRDTTGRRIYGSVAALAEALRVSNIVEVPPMSGFSTAGIVDPPGQPTGTYTFAHLGVIVNLSDYVIGMDRGGETSFFDDFDLDYNKYTYLYETRLSGANVTPQSAISVDLVTAFV